jgi:predicted dehydrogenase/threonine dehydrogenase-like Zn-dependent dehydrogenase
LLGKARARPDQVRKLLDSVAQQGALATYKKAMNRLDSYTPLGYSLCGVVVEVGAGAEQFSVGQVVAAAGNEFALHADVNWVPTNLCVPVPDGVAAEHAAFATVGAIAMQGVRRAEVALGETACVIGLGLIGQLVVRLLVASGVQVVGLDVVAARCRAAEKAGALACAAPDEAGLHQIEQVLLDRTAGLGADHILLAAGGDSNGPVEVAARLARDRARVVDIGKTRLDLPWNAYYDKELDVRFSRSYGPGRYDDRYELEGVDYPAGYVRWTERRNLACFLDLLADGSVDVASLVSGIYPIEEAADVYGRLGSGSLEGVGFLLSYSPAPEATSPERTIRLGARTERPAGSQPRRPSAGVRVGFIGAGNYATSMLLPHLRDNPSVDLVSVATTKSLSGLNAQRKFGFATITTSVETVLDDDTLDAVFIVTRHHSHAALAGQALKRGLAVFVEKPLALTEEQLGEILDAVQETGNDRVMVGFNRRFAPLFTDLRARLTPCRGPLSARYLVNAGRLDPSSWYLNEELEGSRFAGEGGHFIDTLSALVGRDPVEVQAMGAGASVHATLRFPDESVATISYVTDGSPRFPKETLDVSGDGRTGRLDNFQRIAVWSSKGKNGRRVLAGQDKGQRTQLERFVHALRTGSDLPIPLESLVATTRATLAVGTSLATRRPVPL